ncbi:MAGa4850 family ICE element protein [Metamycoplasma equirhinis]|uniref:MAGa4850 family ICE element protein n=1 Tax=Metamycoplasma equirhinis TaxID=92402 RepID=UPI0035934448
MGAFSELQILENEAIINRNDTQLKQFQINVNWRNKYDEKIYDKLNQKAIDAIVKSKLIISESFYQKLKTNKVLIEIFILIKTIGKKGITISELLEFGFKKTSVKIAINKLFEHGILNRKKYENSKVLKLQKSVLKRPNEKFWILKGKDTWKIFLLYGLDAAIMYVINSFKSKVYKWDKKLHSVPIRRKVILQNAYYKNLNISNTRIFLKNKMICDYFIVNYKQMFGIVHKVKKKFISIKTVNEKLIRKFIGYEFKSERYLLMHI